jgi:ribosomal protein L11 methyltransferase
MAWTRLSFLADAADAESFCDALLAAGALAVDMEDADAGTPEEIPRFGEPLRDGQSLGLTAQGEHCHPQDFAWPHSCVSALFVEDAPVAALLCDAAAALGRAVPEFTTARLEDENWVRLTQSQFAPIRISARLWIVPSWHEAPDPGALNLLLDPGMAFGTGSHPTTRLCLEWLEHNLLAGQSVLDYGTGSGILAIAAARLGAGAVTGVDIDPVALTAARANARQNAVAVRFLDAAEAFAGTFDHVVANILANPLRVLAAELCARVRPGGRLALSGILEAQAEDIIAIYAPWLPLAVSGRSEGWICLSGTRPCS